MTELETRPQTDRDAIRGRIRPDPSPSTPNPRSTAPKPRRYVLSGTRGPLGAITPDPLKILTDAFQRNQGAIGQHVTNAIRAMWDAHIKPGEFSPSWRDLGPILKILIAQHYAGSAQDAAEFYRNMHVIAQLGMPIARPAALNGEHLNRMAGSVANGTFYHQLNTQGVSATRASEIARNTLSGAGARFALNGARNTVTSAVAVDPEADGWERLLSPNACSYCAMQAAKGPFSPGTTSFRAHDYCSCLAVPVFNGVNQDNPNAKLRDAWNKVTGTVTGKEARAAWNQYWSENATDAAS